LKEPSVIAVNEVLSYLAKNIPGSTNEREYDDSIYGNGKELADINLSQIGLFKGVGVDHLAVDRVKRNKKINELYQNMWRFEPHLWHADDIASEEEKLAYHRWLTDLNTQIDKMSISCMEDYIHEIRDRKIEADEFCKWKKTNDKEKARIIAKQAKGHFIHEYIDIPIVGIEKKRSKGYLEVGFEKENTILFLLSQINCDFDFEKAKEIVKKVDFKCIPSYWINIAVALLQELRTIQSSNVFDQGYTTYFKGLDYFVTADKAFYEILTKDTHVIGTYMKENGIKTKILYFPMEKNLEGFIRKAI